MKITSVPRNIVRAHKRPHYIPGTKHLHTDYEYISHKKALVHTVPFSVVHRDAGMKSKKVARVILGVSILLISLRAADIVRALQAEDL